MQFRAGQWTYRVIVVEACNDPENPAALGYCDVKNRVLELRVDQSVDVARETLVHEYGHACEAAGIDLDQPHHEKRMAALATIACGFALQWQQQGGDDAIAKLLNITRSSDEIAGQTPEIDWAGLYGPELYSAVLRHVYCRKLSDTEFATYRAEIEAKRLNPFLGECYPIRDKASGGVLIGVKLPALRRLCREHGGRLGNYEWCGLDRVWHDVWIPQPNEPYPYAARCSVMVDGVETKAVALWDAYAEKTVVKGEVFVTGFWARMGPHCLGVCAERLAIGRVIPAMSNVVVEEEMQYRPTRGRRPSPQSLEPKQQQGEPVDQTIAGANKDDVIGSIDELRTALMRRGCPHDVVQTAFISKVEKSNKGLREENPDAFYVAVLREWERTKGR